MGRMPHDKKVENANPTKSEKYLRGGNSIRKEQKELGWTAMCGAVDQEERTQNNTNSKENIPPWQRRGEHSSTC